MEPLVLPISWLLTIVGETEGPSPIQTGVVNTGGVLTVFPSCGIVSSVSFQFTTVGYLKIRVALRTASVTTSFEIIIRCAFKFPPLAATPSSLIGSIGSMTTGMTSGMRRLINHLYGEVILVVSVSVNFLFFPPLVLVATYSSVDGDRKMNLPIHL